MWSEKLDASPGFTHHFFEHLKTKVGDGKRDGKNVFVSLTVDEMKIMKHISFDGKKFVGGVNLGDAWPGD